MALTAADFQLSPEQLQAINDHIQQSVAACVAAGEDLDLPSIEVRFEFVPVFGRSVSVAFDGQTEPKVIESAF